MTEGKEPFGYIAFRRDDEDVTQEFIVIPSKTEMEAWRGGTSNDNIKSDAPKVETSGEASSVSNSASDKIVSLLDRFAKAMNSVHSLIYFTTTMAPAVRFATVNRELVPHAEKYLTIVHKDESRSIYSYSQAQYAEIKKKIDDFVEVSEGHKALPGATLLSLVATFDSYFSEIIRVFLAVHPERYTGSDRQISMKDVFTKASLEEVINQIIDEKLAM